VIVGFFAEHALLFERLAVRSGRCVELNSYPESLASDLIDVAILDSLKLLQEITSQRCRSLYHLLVSQNSQSGAGDCARQWIAAESTTVIPGVEYAKNFFRSKYG
jgi:hypothetical protein